MNESDKPVSSDSSFGEVLFEIKVEMELCRNRVDLEGSVLDWSVKTWLGEKDRFWVGFLPGRSLSGEKGRSVLELVGLIGRSILVRSSKSGVLIWSRQVGHVPGRGDQVGSVLEGWVGQMVTNLVGRVS